MMDQGAIAVAMVQRRVMVVQAARSHSQQDGWLDVYTYIPFGDRLFLASNVPKARISSTDILTLFPSSDVFLMPANGMLELPQQAFSEFLELSACCQKRYENLWNALKGDCGKQRWWKSYVVV